jgi:hypothetical protein
MTYGIEIYLSQLNSIEIAADGQTATIGGEVRSKNLTDALWAAGKQTGEYIIPCTIVVTKGLDG